MKVNNNWNDKIVDIVIANLYNAFYINCACLMRRSTAYIFTAATASGMAIEAALFGVPTVSGMAGIVGVSSALFGIRAAMEEVTARKQGPQTPEASPSAPKGPAASP